MGVCIYLEIAKSVTKEEWASVYEEVLELVDKLPLGLNKDVKIHGEKVRCMVPTREEDLPCGGWMDKDRTRKGIAMTGDIWTLKTAEEYRLYRDLTDGYEYEADASDAMMGALPAYVSIDSDDPRCQHTEYIWGAKTQGEPYHMYLMAIATLIEDRLGKKAFIYGDITRGQCKWGAETAAELLRKPVMIPARCDMDRLFDRVSDLPLSDVEKLTAFETFYLGPHDAEFGKFIRNHYAPEICEAYWKERCDQYTVNQYGFSSILHEYLLYGFDLTGLCAMAQMTAEDGRPLYDTFVEKLMDTQVYLPDKDCTDMLGVNADCESPYGVGTQMAQFFLGAAYRKKVDRYIPLDELRKTMIDAFGDKCDVNNLIDTYLDKARKEAAEGGSASDKLNETVSKRLEEMREEKNTYDIVDPDKLADYKPSDTLSPTMERGLQAYVKFCRNILSEEERIVHYMQTLGAEQEFHYLVSENQYLLLLPDQWETIYDTLTKDRNAFSRYYPAVRVQINSNDLAGLVRAYVLNDDVYALCSGFPDEPGNDKTD